MKQYLVFIWYDTPMGGMNDCIGSYSTVHEAARSLVEYAISEHGLEKPEDWLYKGIPMMYGCQIYDIEESDSVYCEENVTEVYKMLGLV